jgi:hypothetical protein
MGRMSIAALVAAAALALAGCAGEPAHANDLTEPGATLDMLELSADHQPADIDALCAAYASEGEGDAFAWAEDRFDADLDRATVEAWVGENC